MLIYLRAVDSRVKRAANSRYHFNGGSEGTAQMSSGIGMSEKNFRPCSIATFCCSTVVMFGFTKIASFAAWA